MVILTALFALGGRLCHADVRFHALVIGNNKVPLGAGPARAEPSSRELRFADDDAAAFFDLVSGFVDDGHLLVTLDRDTEAVFPNLATVSRPATLRELRWAVGELRQQIDTSRREGHRNVLFVFFSGHGTSSAGAPALAMLDGGITQSILYDEVLDKLHADVVHLIVDACYAEAVVRPRDSASASVRVTAADADAFLLRSTLARFPQVGAIVAAATDARSHEWDLLRHGVFTYELLAALRGAADVNHDGRVEYSEVCAFLSAANHDVGDPRARLAVVARPPDVDRHVALMDRSWLPVARSARLTAIPAHPGLVEVEDGGGHRLATLHNEPGVEAELLLPVGRTIYVRVGEQEARFEATPGSLVPFSSLRFEDPRERSRGALEDALGRGLFATEFGPRYYGGFIDQAREFPSVSFRSNGVAADVAGNGGGTLARADLIAGAGIASTVAQAREVTGGLRVGVRAAGDRGGLASIDLFRAAGDGVAEWRTTVSAGWLVSARLSVLRAWVGAAGGGGVVAQTVDGAATRWSALACAGPVAGVSVRVASAFGLWTEGQAWGQLYRREGRMTVSFVPGAWLGGFFEY